MKLNANTIQEIIYAQNLSHVEDVVRMTALKKLKKFLRYKSSIKAFILDDLLKIWKGLYYCMYMADKPLVQENLAEDIGSLIVDVENSSQKFLFFRAAFETFSREWNGIDTFRMDKFMMLFTRLLRQSFIYLKQNGWNSDEVAQYAKLLETIIICPSDNTNSKPLGLKMHLTDIVLEELAKVGRENLPSDVTVTFLYPYFKVLVVSKQLGFIKYIENKIFGALIRQSDLGLRHQDDLTIGEMEVDQVAEDEETVEEELKLNEKEEPLDPRAGGVDVYIPQLKPNYAQIADIFISLGSLKEVNQKKRNMLYKHSNEFLDLEMGTYPFQDPVVNLPEDVDLPRKKQISEGVKQVKVFEDKVKEASKNNKKLTVGNNGAIIRKQRKPWTPLLKKSKEEKLKEFKKGNINPEFAMNEIMVKLAAKNKVPKYFDFSSASSIVKGKKVETSELPSLLPDGVANADSKCASPKSDKRISTDSPKDVTSINLSNSVAKIISFKKEKCNVTVKGEQKKKAILKKSKKHILKENINELPNKKVNKKNKNKELSTDKSVKINQQNFNGVINEKNSETVTAVKKQVSKLPSIDCITNIPNYNSLTEEKLAFNKPLDIAFNSLKGKKRKLENEEKNKVKKKMMLENSNKEAMKAIKKNSNNIQNSKSQEWVFNSEWIEEKPLKVNKVNVKKHVNLKKKKLPCASMDSQANHSDESMVNNMLKLNVKKSKSSLPVGILKKTAAKEPSKINMVIKPQKLNTKGKLLKINLRENTEHDLNHYRKVLSASPGIPFSAHKKPRASALKATPSPKMSKNQKKKIKRLQDRTNKF